MSKSILPEEILHSVVESLAYNTSFVERNLFRLRWKNATNELFSFSAACHQFRRISLPFLFSYIKIQRLEDLKMFKDQCISNASFAGSIRSLHVSDPSNWKYTSQTTNVIKHLLCYLKDLSQLSVSFCIDMSFLAALNHHSVKAVVITSLAQLPETSCSLDLEKFIFADAIVYGEHLNGHLACGMQMRSLIIRQDYMDDYSGMQKFNGLCEIEVQLTRTSSFSWLPGFTHAHPSLKKISFTDSFDYLRSSNTIPFIQPLFEALREQGVYNAVRIQGFSDSINSFYVSYRHDWRLGGYWITSKAGCGQSCSAYCAFCVSPDLYFDFRARMRPYRRTDHFPPPFFFTSSPNLALLFPASGTRISIACRSLSPGPNPRSR